MLYLVLIACHGSDEPETSDASITTWDEDVSLDADYTVAPGETLVIEPGVIVTLAAEVGLVVQGELLAVGTEAAPIVFTGDPEARWRSIVFESTASSATFEDVDDYVGGSVVEHAVVENATRGMEIAGASPYLHAVTFQDNEIPNTIETIGGAALLVSAGATPRIRDCTFTRNVANIFAFGGALYVDDADPIVQDSVFTENYASYGGAVATDRMASAIVGSRFEANSTQSDGGAISLVSSVSALLNNRLTGNFAEVDGGGLHVCVDCDPHAAPSLMDNVITDNETSSDDPDGNAGGIGAAFLGNFVTNEIHGNTRAGEPSDFGWFNLVAEDWPDWVAAPVLSDVWWGTEDEAEIALAVYDGADDDRYGQVALDAVRSAPIPDAIPRVVIASRRQEYDIAGDEIPVFLTVYNPGEATTARLSLEVDGEAFQGELAYPGATQEGEAWMLDLPENSVWFGTIESSTYDGSSVEDHTWEATLMDAQGELIGVPTQARYLTGPTN